MPYVNVAPFFHFWKDPTLEFVQAPPRVLGKMAREGHLDLAPLPVFDGFQLEESFEPLGQFGIAATGRVLSVFLFSRKPIENLDRAVISLTIESSTSVALLKLLLRERFGVTEPVFTGHPAERTAKENRETTPTPTLPRDAGEGDRETTSTGSHGEAPTREVAGSPDAILLIGDRALETSRRPGEWAHVYDLAQLWTDWTGLPFVFARWVIRKGLPSATKTRLAAALGENLEQAMIRLEEVAATEASRSGLDQGVLLDYLRNFTFRLGAAEKQAIGLFRAKLMAQGLL